MACYSFIFMDILKDGIIFFLRGFPSLALVELKLLERLLSF
jgi:hypothetical protein